MTTSERNLHEVRTCLTASIQQLAKTRASKFDSAGYPSFMCNPCVQMDERGAYDFTSPAMKLRVEGCSAGWDMRSSCSLLSAVKDPAEGGTEKEVVPIAAAGTEEDGNDNN